MFQVRDEVQHVLYDVYLDRDGTIDLASPKDGIDTEILRIDTARGVGPGREVKLEVMVHAGHAAQIVIDGYPGPVWTPDPTHPPHAHGQRYLRVGIDHHDSISSDEPVAAFHRQVRYGSTGWVGSTAIAWLTMVACGSRSASSSS